MADEYKQEELAAVDYGSVPKTGWMDTPADFRKGNWLYAGGKKHFDYLDMPNSHEWAPLDEDWNLPANWKEIILEGMKERLAKYRSFRLFMDICVRCGACADKCHFYLGSADPKNMPVLRAELLRSVYKRYFTKAGKTLGKLVGARDLTIDVLKEWFYYFYQCTECRRCSVFCPYGIDTAEVTMIGRELLALVGISVGWIMEPAANCYQTGNHLGVRPNTFKDNLEFAAEDLADITGIEVEVPIDKAGADVLVVVPSADYFANPHYFTFLGYLALFHEIGLNYTFSPFATEGGNFGLFLSKDMMKRLNVKIYQEAKRLGVKWILGCECGHMWRVLHQYMDTMNGPADFLEVPKSPVTGTVFKNAAATSTVHICEFTADLLKHDKLNLDISRNDEFKVTFHDSCNPARAVGLLEEPRYILDRVLNHFVEMPENTIREQTFCCGGGSGLGADENMEARLRGGLPRANAVKYVHDKYGVNTLSCICAIDKAVLPPLVEYWVPGVEVAGIHEFVGNALIMKGEKKRELNLRSEPLPNGGEEVADE
ncbi:MAG: sulfate reduction electron transfer complex DsrMKJOP subunit DsrK [Planctomycetota bacterium]